VRDYGMMLVTDHTAHLAKVREIITDEDVGASAPPTNPEGDRIKAMLAWLENTPAGKEWDAAYLRFQAQHHQNNYDLFSANIKQAHDDDLEDLIEKSLLSFAKHRDAAKSAATGLGVAMQ
jgi:predicted outer membrane protein